MPRHTRIYDENNTCIDIEVCREGQGPIRILGSGGAQRELACLPKNTDMENYLPVFLGIGMGHAYHEFRNKYPTSPIAIIDKEEDLWQAAGINIEDKNTLIINTSENAKALSALTKWQNRHAGKPFFPIAHSFYQRLDKVFYGELRDKLLASQKFDFWGKSRSPKFQNSTTRFLLISSQYFLLGEIDLACKRLGIECKHLLLENDEISSQEFIAQLLNEVISFKPDALLTLNHSGVDREGILMNLLEKLQLPFISWFVDNPHLVLSAYTGLTSPWLNIFTWDKDNIPSLKAQGFENTYYLPLGTDPMRFHPRNKKLSFPKKWESDVSFVGNSMLAKVEKRWSKSRFPQKYFKTFLSLGVDFSKTDEKSITTFIENQTNPTYKSLIEFYKGIKVQEEKLAFETGLTWEATREYRFECVKQLFDFHPLIVGDDAWKNLFSQEKRPWRWHDAISYYTELPNFYTHSKINFNCTSMQMKGASNQRILDVPAAGAFVITDWREQMETMFDEGTEVICFREKEEIPDLIRYYLKHDKERENITLAARKRVLACHTWDKRVEEIVRVMREKYGK